MSDYESFEPTDSQVDLTSFDDEFETADAPSYDEVPDGKYQVKIQTAKLESSQKGECAFVCNCFVANRDILKAIRWDEDLKVDEHWDFFWRAKIAGVRVGVAMDHVFPHIHVDPPAYKRHRPVFLRAALRKHGLRKVLWK
jgi:hypothetical protein